jgi:hypothetical protein
VLVDTKGFRWDTRLNLNFLENKVMELVDSDTIFAGNIPDLIVGQPLDFFYLLQYGGVNPANGRAMVVDRNGNLTYNPGFEDGAVRGSGIPTRFGGWSNTFSYKGLSLDVFFQYQFGNKAFNSDLYNILDTGGNDNRRDDIKESWSQPGDLTNYPQLTNNGTIQGIDQSFGFIGTTRFMSDGGYVRLKTLTLAYDFSNALLSSIGLRSARIFVQGVNLLTWTKFDGIDPEVVGNNNANGVSAFGGYPLGRQFSVGVNIGL